MRNPLIILFLLSWFPTIGISQQSLVDSLEQALQKEHSALQTIDIHLGLARNHAFLANSAATKEHATIALGMAQKEDWADGQIAALLFLGVWEVNNGGGSEVLFEYIQRALKIANDQDARSGLAMANYHLAEYYSIDKGDAKKAQEVLLAAIEKIDDSVSDQHIGNIYKNLGAIYNNNGLIDKAIVTYNQALKHFDKVRRQPLIIPELGHSSAMSSDRGLLNKGQVCVYLGSIYANQGDFDLALSYTKQAENIYRTFQNWNQIGWALNKTATIQIKQGAVAKAIENRQQALKVFEKIDNKYRMVESHLALGNDFFNTKAYDAAKDNFTKAVEYCKIIKDSIYLSRAYAYLGKTHIQTGASDIAMEFLEKGLVINTNLGYVQERYVVLNPMAAAFVAKKNYAEAIRINKEIANLHYQFKTYYALVDNLTQLTHLYTETNQLDSATHYAALTENYVPKYTSAKQQIALAKALASLYEKTGQLDKAIVQHKNHFQLFGKTFDDKAQQILKNEQVRQNVVAIETEKERVELAANLLTTRNQLYLALALALGLLLLLGSYLFYQLRKTKKQLEYQNIQLQQLNATKDKFFGIIAHDIRSPIVALDGVGEQMDYYLEKNNPEKLQRLAGRVDKTAKRLSSLLDNLLNWALLQQGVIPYHPKYLNIKEVTNDVMIMFKSNAELKDITLSTNIAHDLKVYADESAMNTILRNLVSNAIKFTPTGGKVSLSTETKGDKIFIKINDTGTGIATEKLTRLFSLEKQRSKGTAGEKGTGLGLTLVKELAELNKGTIRVMSELGKGSEFIVGLPLAA